MVGEGGVTSLRTEDRQLEGLDLEREQGLEEEFVEAEETELPMLVGEEAHDIELAHRGKLFDALQLVLAEQHVEIARLQLPQRETKALEYLQTAVTGRDELGEFVYAEDRSAMLEQALAILQANLTFGDAAQLAELHAKFDTMSERVATLRAELLNLEDAQDELIDGARFEVVTSETETEDKPGDKDDKKQKQSLGFIARALNAISGTSAAEKAGGLFEGPEVEDEPVPPSTLSGPDLPAEPARPTTLVGPEVKEAPKPPSSLTGADLPPEPAKPSTLDGPEHKEPPKPPSTL